MTEQEKERSTVGETMTAEPWNSQAFQETRQSFFFFFKRFVAAGTPFVFAAWLDQ